jgi:hypothetical protein
LAGVLEWSATETIDRHSSRTVLRSARTVIANHAAIRSARLGTRKLIRKKIAPTVLTTTPQRAQPTGA